jgi:hypothetical protein
MRGGFAACQRKTPVIPDATITMAARILFIGGTSDFLSTMQRRRGKIPSQGPGDWIMARCEYRMYISRWMKEGPMAGTKSIGKKISGIESQLKKRVRSLEKDLTGLVKKLEKKESEVKKLKEKMTSKFVKNVKKKAKKAKKKVAKRLTNIF